MYTCNDCGADIDGAIMLFPEWLPLCGECYRMRFNLPQVNIVIPDNPTNWRAMFPDCTIPLPGDDLRQLSLFEDAA